MYGVLNVYMSVFIFRYYHSVLCKLYAPGMIQHFYFTLESSRPPQGVKALPPPDDILPDEDAPPLPPPYNPEQESQPSAPPPVYQDICSLTSRGAVINGMDT